MAWFHIVVACKKYKTLEKVSTSQFSQIKWITKDIHANICMAMPSSVNMII